MAGSKQAIINTYVVYNQLMTKKIPNDNYTSVILEEVRDQNKTILEMVGFLSDKVQVIGSDVNVLKLDMQEVKRDIVVIKSDIVVMKSDIVAIKEDIDDLKAQSDTILEVIGGDVVEVKQTQKDHERRITKLETATA